MHFNELDAIMRRFETDHDRLVPDETYMVVRLDGRGFTKLTQDRGFEKPFDTRFTGIMADVTKHLFTIGFSVVYGYVQSDEISLLLNLNDQTFKRKDRKIISVMAGEASAKFSIITGVPGSFDARISELPEQEHVIDYFRWRQEDARRNALNSYCYWTLRQKARMDARKASRFLERQSIADKKRLLLGYNIDFDGTALGGIKVPTHQINGIGMRWMYMQKNGFNPVKKEYVTVFRNELKVLEKLPSGVEYASMLRILMV